MTQKEQQLLDAVNNAVVSAKASVASLSGFDVRNIYFTYGVAGLNVAAKRLERFLKSRATQAQPPEYPKATYP